MTLELAKRNDVLPNRTDWQIMREMAEALHESGLLPSWIKNPMAALAVIQKGAELGLQPMYSLSRISMIQGKPCCDAEGMAAMIYRDHGPNALAFIETTPEVCTVEYRRQGGKPGRLSFTIEDARRAGLLTKDTWKGYPQAMLRARAISAAARMAFPDTIGGLYTPEELGAEVQVNEHGETTVIDVPAQASSAPTPIRPEPTETEEERARAMQRETLNQEYTRLAKVAVERGHKDAAKIGKKKAQDLDFEILERSVAVLKEWEAKLPKPQPAPAVEDNDTDEPF